MPFLAGRGQAARGYFGGGAAPIITIASTTNFNQNSAVFNATVDPSGLVTSVKFQYSLNDSSWTDSGTVSGITGVSQSVTYSHSSPALSNGTLYYVRAVATNAVGTSTSSSTTFTTYSLRTATYTSGSGTWTNPVPTSGTSGLAITSIADVLVVGGGGGAFSTPAGGGGVAASNSMTISGNLSYAVGDGGSNNVLVASTTDGTASSLTRTGTWTMTGGAGLKSVSPYSNAGSSGAGSGGTTFNSSANAGGVEAYGCVDSATGGGGGAGGVGGSAYYVGYTLYAGNGGSAVTYYGITVSSGGGGYDAYDGDGIQDGTTPSCSYGGGGYYYPRGTVSQRVPQSGLVRFTYYGP